MILFIVFIILILILTIICDELRDIECFSLLVFVGAFILALLNAFAIAFTQGYEVTATYEEKQYNISGLESKTSQEFYLDGQYKNFFLYRLWQYTCRNKYRYELLLFQR